MNPGCAMSCQRSTSVGQGVSVLKAEVKLSTRHPFDDQHSAGAGGTTQLVGWFGAIGAGNCAAQLAAACEGGFPFSVCEQSEVADADQSFGAKRGAESGAGTRLLKLS